MILEWHFGRYPLILLLLIEVPHDEELRIIREDLDPSHLSI